MLIRRACHAAFEVEGFGGSAEVNVIIVDNAYIRYLNNQYRGVDEPTDVLSFSTFKDGKYEINPETGRFMLGDIVISIVKAEEQAEKGDYTLNQEVVRLVSHGMFHLFGHDHEKDDVSHEQMKRCEGKVLSFVGFPEAVFL
jgi:probable rRNA maturation factor